jgi:RHS repeat-associated protein
LTGVCADFTETETPTAEYRYNGLGQRIMWRYDANASGTVASTKRYHYMYDDRWRVVVVFRDADSTPKESFVYHAAGNAGQGSSSYIDSVILRDRDVTNGWTGAADGTLEERRYYGQNWRADVVAMTKSNGDPLEYVFYSPYGEPIVHPVADIDMDGDVDVNDLNSWANGAASGASDYTGDINFDDEPDAYDDALFDESYAANLGLNGRGLLTTPGVGNRKGYAGYEHDESLTMYHVRHRVYRADLGRWMTRDPLGYVDGMGLYEYVGGMAVTGRDPSGLAMAICPGGRCGGTIDDITGGQKDSVAGPRDPGPIIPPDLFPAVIPWHWSKVSCTGVAVLACRTFCTAAGNTYEKTDCYIDAIGHEHIGCFCRRAPSICDRLYNAYKDACKPVNAGGSCDGMADCPTLRQLCVNNSSCCIARTNHMLAGCWEGESGSYRRRHRESMEHFCGNAAKCCLRVLTECGGGGVS